MGNKLLLAPVLGLLLIAFAMGVGSLPGPMFDRAQAEGEQGTLYIDVLPDASNTASGYGTIDVCRDDLAIDDTFDIDIVIAGANDLAGPYWTLNYDRQVLEVIDYDWKDWKLGSGGIDLTDPVPDTDGEFSSTYAQPTGVDGDGVLLRVTLQVIANGSSDLTLCTIVHDCPNMANSDGTDFFYPDVLVDDPPGTLRVAVGQSCSEAPQPSPLPTGTVSPTVSQVTPTPAATPAVTATATPTLAATATATPTPAPQAGGEDTGNGFPWVAVYAGVGAGVVALIALGLFVGLLRRR